VLDGHLALHDQVKAVGTAVRVVEKGGEDLGGRRERWVGDHPKRGLRRPESTKVRWNDDCVSERVAVCEVAAQHVQPRGVALDRPHVDAGVEQWDRQRPGAGAEIDDELAGTETERTDESRDDALINEEVLTEVASPRVALGRL